jgi:ABC-2 type transport system ATP-binding protein
MSTGRTTDAIVTEGLGKAYGPATALHGLDLRVPRGSIFGFLGPNGAGKTTTIKLLLGLTRPTVGSAAVVGMDVATDGLAVRERVGYLGQQPQFYDHLTARETLRLTARLFYAGPGPSIEARVGEMLDLVGLADLADRPVRGFSGGERQRLGIAQAQVNDPELLILDEPAAALDPIGRRDVLEVMQRLRERTTIFYSTHILDDVERVSDTVAILSRGRLVAQAPVAGLLNGGAVTYSLTVRGPANGLGALLGRHAWVTGVETEQHAATTTLRVSVDDEAAAERSLLRLVLDDAATSVTAFGRTRQSLEDLFIELVQEGVTA